MTTLMMIFGGCLIGLGISLMGIGKPKTNKPWKPKHLPYQRAWK